MAAGSVAIEATYGWYWAVVALIAAEFDVHLAHPYGFTSMRKRKRVKIDARDAYELANLPRIGSLPGAYIASHEVGLPANAQQRCTFRRDKVRGCL